MTAPQPTDAMPAFTADEVFGQTELTQAGLTAEQEIRARALAAAATLLAPTLADMSAAFKLPDMAEIGGGAIELADRFAAHIADAGTGRAAEDHAVQIGGAEGEHRLREWRCSCGTTSDSLFGDVGRAAEDALNHAPNATVEVKGR